MANMVSEPTGHDQGRAEAFLQDMMTMDDGFLSGKRQGISTILIGL
jgi:hypothetical protein